MQSPLDQTSRYGLLNDLKRGLGQQMFFWGRDVMTAGNLLIKHGFEKLPSPGHQGTSCYRKVWQNGLIELHGHCAGWYPQVASSTPGFLFVRRMRNCYAHDLPVPVIPGDYATHQSKHDSARLLHAGQHFCTWLDEYESWVQEKMGAEYRDACHAMFSKLPASRPWLRPPDAQRWWQGFVHHPDTLSRARRFSS